MVLLLWVNGSSIAWRAASCIPRPFILIVVGDTKNRQARRRFFIQFHGSVLRARPVHPHKVTWRPKPCVRQKHSVMTTKAKKAKSRSHDRERARSRAGTGRENIRLISEQIRP